MEINPAELTIRDRYKLLIGAIVPRPIAFVSTISPDGRANLAPFSFFNGVGSNPMTVMFCPANNSDGSDKDTMRNCRSVADGGTGEFVINAATEQYAAEMVATAESLPYGESEFDFAGLKQSPSVVVKPPRVAESLIAFECRTMQIVQTNPGAPGGGNIVIGEVLHIHIRDEVVNEQYHVDAKKLSAIGRMGGADYCTTRQCFEIPVGGSTRV